MTTEISRKKVRVNGKVCRRMVASFGKKQHGKILILDNYYAFSEEIPNNTYLNMCHEVCATLKRGHTFIYLETNKLDAGDIRDLIEEIEPTGIMFADESPFKKLGLDPLQYFGFVRKWKKIPTILTTAFKKWASTEGFSKGESGKNLIGFNLKDLLYVTQGHNPFTVPSPEQYENCKMRVIKTREQFDKFMATMMKRDAVAIDVEGRNLNRIVNRLFTMQFGFKVKGEIVTYILPWQHRDHVWDDDDLAYMKKKLRHWLYTTETELVFHYAPFDVGQMMVVLGMAFFPPSVYDTIAGHFATDENHKFLDGIMRIDSKKYSPYGLEHMEPKYGIKRPDTTIGKGDRNNMERFSLEEICEYGAFDVVSPLLLRDMQMEMCTTKYVGYKKRNHFHRLVIHQLGVMVKTFAMLMNTGIHIDMNNAASLVQKDSVFTETINKIRDEILQTKAGKKANDILLGESGGMKASTGIFSSKKAEVFSLTKPHHLRTLFFKVMKLEPVREGKSGEPSTDKAFQKAYKDKPEVKLFGQFNKVKTLKSNFADSIVKKAKNDADFINDGRLRPNFGFVKVLPGRISVNGPNSQNIPTRSDKDFELHAKLVKSIKANFAVKFGRIMLGSDFSAHEVRIAGIISEDPTIRKIFLIANNAIRKYRLSPVHLIEKAAEVLAREGDIHIQNVKFFFKKDVDKKHVLRDQIKQVVFGVLYGKMAKALAKELGIEPEEAQSLIDIMFEKWGLLKSWIDNVHETGKAEYMIHYPNHRIRHLWAYMHDDIWVHHAMDRRGVNSPIQGFASDIGIVAVYCYKTWVHYNITMKKRKFDSQHTNIVHDAQYSDNLYEHMPLVVYLTEHSMSTLPMEYFEQKFNYKLTIPLSYGLEFGTNWAGLNDWNFRPETLLDMLRDEGKKMDKKDKQIDRVIADTKYMLKIRTKELETNPYKMLVTNDNIEKTLFKKMHMFNREAA